MKDTQVKQEAKAAEKTEFLKRALHYHEKPIPGKLAIALTKPMFTEEDLALAYSPGVAEPVREIASNPEKAYAYTAKGNVIAVVTDGSAVLGLGNVGPLASKPVMEGKAALFKHFANVDVFDIEIESESPEAFIDTVRRIAPTFGGINLEDIKAPECFAIEKALSEQLDIPVFHDDQHGTAIIVAAALLNALELKNKSLSAVKIVCLGAGAAGIASMNLLITLGADPKNILMLDSKGVIHHARENLNIYKKAFVQHTEKRTLADASVDADVFVGVSGPNLMTGEMLASMAKNPIVFALSNPDPEISPELAYLTRDDVVMATGRSDYPNQVNNVLCFPFIFRGALDVRASCINAEMKAAAVESIRKLAFLPVPDEVKKAYPNQTDWEFGPQYILPKPVDPRLCDEVSKAVAKAAVESGVSK
jgi:malic enzyme